MSRSRRYTPCAGITTCESEKHDKRIANRLLRRRNKQLYRKATDDVFQFNSYELTDMVWVFGGKDGKSWFDPQEHPELMRK